MIQRFPGSAFGRSSAVVYNGLAFTVATAKIKSRSLGEQTRDALEALEARLREAGSSKRRILSATVYITDMARKAEMNAAWDAWIDPVMRRSGRASALCWMAMTSSRSL